MMHVLLVGLYICNIVLFAFDGVRLLRKQKRALEWQGALSLAIAVIFFFFLITELGV